jgi:hypothetical protein
LAVSGNDWKQGGKDQEKTELCFHELKYEGLRCFVPCFLRAQSRTRVSRLKSGP